MLSSTLTSGWSPSPAGNHDFPGRPGRTPSRAGYAVPDDPHLLPLTRRTLRGSFLVPLPLNLPDFTPAWSPVHLAASSPSRQGRFPRRLLTQILRPRPDFSASHARPALSPSRLRHLSPSAPSLRSLPSTPPFPFAPPTCPPLQARGLCPPAWCISNRGAYLRASDSHALTHSPRGPSHRPPQRGQTLVLEEIKQKSIKCIKYRYSYIT